MKKFILLLLLVVMASGVFAEEPLVETFDSIPTVLQGSWFSVEEEDYHSFVAVASAKKLVGEAGQIEILSVEKHRTNRGLMYILVTADKDMTYVLFATYEQPAFPVFLVYKKDKKIYSRTITIK